MRLLVPLLALLLASGVACQHADWVGNSLEWIGQRRLYEVTLPGTHDSGSYNLRTTIDENDSQNGELISKARDTGSSFIDVDEVIAAWSKTQSKTIAEQLDAGIRFFDLRVTWYQNEFHVAHMQVGEPLVEYLTAVQQFLQQHTKEVVVLQISRFYGSANEEDAVQVAQVTDLLERVEVMLREWLVLDVSQTVQELVDGNQRCLIEWNHWESAKTVDGFWVLLVEASWHDTSDLQALTAATRTQLRDTGGGNNWRGLPLHFGTQWILTTQVDDIQCANTPFTDCPETLQGLARTAALQLDTLMRELLHYHWGIVTVDFFEETNVVELALLLNRRVLCDTNNGASLCSQTPSSSELVFDAEALPSECRKLAFDNSQCEVAPLSMFSRCPLSCGFFDLTGAPGFPCGVDADCWHSRCLLGSFCAVEAPLELGVPCGADDQCKTGICGRIKPECLESRDDDQTEPWWKDNRWLAAFIIAVVLGVFLLCAMVYWVKKFMQSRRYIYSLTLYILNTLVLLISIALLIIAVITKTNGQASFIPEWIFDIVIIMGVLLLVVALLGLAGAWKAEDRLMRGKKNIPLYLYGVFVFLAVLLTVVLIIVTISDSERVDSGGASLADRAVSEFQDSVRTRLTNNPNMWGDVQSWLGCCGYDSNIRDFDVLATGEHCAENDFEAPSAPACRPKLRDLAAQYQQYLTIAFGAFLVVECVALLACYRLSVNPKLRNWRVIMYMLQVLLFPLGVALLAVAAGVVALQQDSIAVVKTGVLAVCILCGLVLCVAAVVGILGAKRMKLFLENAGEAREELEWEYQMRRKELGKGNRMALLKLEKEFFAKRVHAKRKNTNYLLVGYTVVVFAVLVVQAVMASVVLHNTTTLQEALADTSETNADIAAWDDLFTQEFADNPQAWVDMQKDLSCCGYNNTDAQVDALATGELCTAAATDNSIPACRTQVFKKARQWNNVVGYTAALFVAIEALCIISSWCLLRCVILRPEERKSARSHDSADASGEEQEQTECVMEDEQLDGDDGDFHVPESDQQEELFAPRHLPLETVGAHLGRVKRMQTLTGADLRSKRIVGQVLCELVLEVEDAHKQQRTVHDRAKHMSIRVTRVAVAAGKLKALGQKAAQRESQPHQEPAVHVSIDDPPEAKVVSLPQQAQAQRSSEQKESRDGSESADRESSPDPSDQE